MLQTVSIIIPVYNVEKYLNRCVDSVIKQTYFNLEIILVNDGSSDASPDICEHYTRIDNRTTVIHQENKGLSEARNAGFHKSNGRYIYFLDSDDYVREDAIGILVRAAENESTDIVSFNRIIVDENDAPYKGGEYFNKCTTNGTYSGLMSGYEMLRLMLQNRDYSASVPTYFYNKEFLQTNGLTFYPGILHEDELFTFVSMMNANRIMHISDQLQYRRWRAGSIMTSKFTYKNMVGLCRVAYEIIEFCDSLPESKYCIEIVNNVFNLLSSAINMYKNFMADGDIPDHDRQMACQELFWIIDNAKSSAYLSEYFSCQKDLDVEYREAGQVLFYGAGKLCKRILERLVRLNLRLPGMIWDKSAETIFPIMGIEVSKPDYSSLNDDGRSMLIVCAADPSIFTEVKRICGKNGFSRVFGYWEFNELLFA